MVFPCRKTDVWSTPTSIFNSLTHLGLHVNLDISVDVCSVFDKDGNYTDENLDKFFDRNYNVILNMDYGKFTVPKLCRDNFKNKNACFIIECGDDPQQFIDNKNKVAQQDWDILLTPDLRCVNKYPKTLNKQVLWWPQFGDSQVFYPIKNRKLSCIISTTCGYRPMLDRLKEILPEQAVSNKIGLIGEEHNIHLNNGKFIFQQSRHDEITRRLFEGALVRRPIITDRISMASGLHTLFQDNHNIILYGSWEELLDKLRYYEVHYDEAERIATKAYCKVINEHTQTHRTMQILCAIDDFFLNS